MPQPKARIKLRVCRGGTCGPDGGSSLVGDLEDLCSGQLQVEPWSCLDKCGQGPNVEVFRGEGQKTIIETGIKNLADAQHLVEKYGGPSAESTAAQRKVVEIKWKARREEDPVKRLSVLQEAFTCMDAGKPETFKPDPGSKDAKGYASLLLMRAQAQMKVAGAAPPVDDPRLARVLADSTRAKELRPIWASAEETLATALERSGRHDESLAAFKEALSIGTGIDVGSVKRAIRRVERKVELKAGGTGNAAAPKPTLQSLGRATDGDKPSAPSAFAAPPAAQNASGGARSSSLSDASGGARSSSLSAGREEILPAKGPRWDEFEVLSTSMLNHNCVQLELKAKVPAGQIKGREKDRPVDIFHFDVRCRIDGTDVIRPYTPINNFDGYRQGQVDLMVKVYPAGKLSKHLGSVTVGDKLQLSSPKHTLDDVPGEKGLVLVAGGSSVTVAIQVCAAALRLAPSAKVHLYMCNRTVGDVLFGSRLEAMQRFCPAFHVTHVIEEGSLPKSSNSRLAYQSGRIKASTFQGVAPRTPVLLSGPPGLVENVYYTLLRLGWRDADVDFLDGLPPGSERKRDSPQAFDEIENNSNLSSPSFLERPFVAQVRGIYGQIWSIATCRRRRSSQQEEVEPP